LKSLASASCVEVIGVCFLHQSLASACCVEITGVCFLLSSIGILLLRLSRWRFHGNIKKIVSRSRNLTLSVRGTYFRKILFGINCAKKSKNKNSHSDFSLIPLRTTLAEQYSEKRKFTTVALKFTPRKKNGATEKNMQNVKKTYFDAGKSVGSLGSRGYKI